MWAFLVLYILGQNICQAIGEDNSTQMYYVKLTIEESAIANLTNIILRSTPFVSSTTLNVDDLQMTTKCQSGQTGLVQSTECSCMPNFRWSDKVCKSSQKCCGTQCTFTGKPAPMCISDKTVSIKGSIILNGPEHHDCLKEKSSEDFQKCNNKLLQEMKKVFSTLTGFDILTITKYRVGSVIADFEMTVADKIKQQDLIEKSGSLSSNLSASLNLNITGVVDLKMPSSTVCNNDQPKVTCTLKEMLNASPVWQLKHNDEVFQIFDGTESTLTSAALETSVTLTNVSQRWTGEYTCFYHETSGLNTITHKASAVMDISLLPNIVITTVPAFPRCRKSSDLMSVRVKCDIGSSHENYNVTWESVNTFTNIQSAGPPENRVYEGDAIVRCDEPSKVPNLKCKFKNRCNDERTASTDVNIIYEEQGDKFCAADGDWEDTKAGFSAVLKCKDAAGQRRRECLNSTQAEWKPEVSGCVNQAVDSVLQKAIIVDTGLGDVDVNAAHVFDNFEKVTNNSKDINTFANMNASVQVLSSLSEKLKSIDNESVVDDFLESSSNLLEKSLQESWTSEEGKASLAGRYLISVEHLIGVTNLTRAPKTKNIEVAENNCKQGSQCQNKVFSVTIVLDSKDRGSVKTAGFKELQSYLPNNNSEFEPNSIVVSTTTEHKLDTVEVKINFPLLKPRPPNVLIKCVSWDNKTGDWSSVGCEWEGPFDEGLCICSHLSSFAILMSKDPVKINGITEATYVGLSISVVSLIIGLVIEVTVWSAVVKTNTLYLRHTAHCNISLCLLIADCCFLASSNPSDVSDMWCKIFVVLKHFCYLSMFFWMLCLSSILLHQAVFLFHNVSKKIYLRFSLFVGYVCPLLIVVITFLVYEGGAEGAYFSQQTCWLIYIGLMKGSIHTFVIPVGIIVFFNVLSMLVVIMKLLDNPINAEKSNEKEKKACITVMRSVILLTPIFGVTWIFGFAVLLLDLTHGPVAIAVNYAFTLLNAFQGLFILLSTCLGDKLTRDALLNRLKKNAPGSTTNSSTKLDSIRKK